MGSMSLSHRICSLILSHTLSSCGYRDQLISMFQHLSSRLVSFSFDQLSGVVANSKSYTQSTWSNHVMLTLLTLGVDCYSAKFTLLTADSMWQEIDSVVPEVSVLRRFLFATAHLSKECPKYWNIVTKFSFGSCDNSTSKTEFSLSFLKRFEAELVLGQVSFNQECYLQFLQQIWASNKENVIVWCNCQFCHSK